MLTQNDYPDLQNFIGCSFHQDWDATADNPQAVVDGNLARQDAETIRQMTAQIGAALASPVTNEELAKWLEIIGCYVILDAEGYTARSFVTMIGERIRALGG